MSLFWFRLAKPKLTVIVPVFNGSDTISPCVRSIAAQGIDRIEIIVVDDCSTDDTRETVRALARKDPRIRLLSAPSNGGPGKARNLGVDAARGKIITFVDADDKVLPRAYQRMLDTLSVTGSDFVSAGYQRSGRLGTHRPEITRRVHAKQALQATLATETGVLEEPVLWNKLYRTDFWRRHVGPIPEDRNYEDQEPAIRAALYAKTFDILDFDAYSWSLPDGRGTRSQSKRTIEDLRSRALVVSNLLELSAQMPIGARRSLVATILGRDLGLYLSEVPYASDDYWDVLQGLAIQTYSAADRETLLEVPVLDRILCHIGAHGTRSDVVQFVGALDEYGRHVAWRSNFGDAWQIDEDFSHELSIQIPKPLLERGPKDWRIRSKLWKARWKANGDLQLHGYAFVPGIECSEIGSSYLSLEDEKGRTVWAEELSWQDNDWVDVEANDPWTSYSDAAFEATIPNNLFETHQAVSFFLTVHMNVGGTKLSRRFDYPATETPTQPHLRGSAPRELKKTPEGILTVSFSINASIPEEAASRANKPTNAYLKRVTLDGDQVLLEGTGMNNCLKLALKSSQDLIELDLCVNKDGSWSGGFDLSDGAIPSAGLFLVSGADRAWRSVVPGDGLVPGHPLRLIGKARAVAVSQVAGVSTGITLSAPITNVERSRYGRQRLIEMAPPQLLEAIVYDSFTGKSASDNPLGVFEQIKDGTLATELRDLIPPVDGTTPVYWSVQDGTMRVPAGAEPIYVGSARWFEIMRSAKLIVTNNHLPIYFKKSPGQFWLQTWHGTPMKKLLFDAPRETISLLYRRTMTKQVPDWDLLLAQDEQAGGNLRSSTRYSGDIVVVEQPRNQRLFKPGLREKTRARLGLSDDDKVILYAPTWRKADTDPRNSRDTLEIAHTLATSMDGTVLLRTHHMAKDASVRTSGDVLDVSHEPRVEDLMVASDVLVSDYSSIFYDYALLAKPMFAYAPDIEDYEKERGFYRGWPKGVISVIRRQPTAELVPAAYVS